MNSDFSWLTDLWPTSNLVCPTIFKQCNRSDIAPYADTAKNVSLKLAIIEMTYVY